MKKLAFIENCFQKQSPASALLVVWFKENFDVQIFWNKLWNGEPRVDLDSISEDCFDVLFLFQRIRWCQR